MEMVVLSLFAFLLGFVAAIPVGAVQVELAKRTLHQHYVAAFSVIVGALVADIIYGCIAFFGVFPFIKHPVAVAWFEFGSALFLLALMFLTLRQSRAAHVTTLEMRVLRSKRASFATGFLLAVLNPLMIFWWLIGAKLVRSLHIVGYFGPRAAVVFMAFGVAGLAGYLLLLIFVLYKTRRFLSLKAMRYINFFLSLFLLLLAFYFLTSSLRVLW